MKIITPIIILIIASFALFSWYASLEPNEFHVVDEAMKHYGTEDPAELRAGYVFSSTLAHIGESILGNTGGYVTNDPLFGMVMDNRPSWEAGALLALRDAVSALRNHLARSQSQSKENANLAKAEPYFYFEADSFILPATEDEYTKGINELHSYLNDLADPNNSSANFFARGDNLGQYLQVVAQRLGDLSHRLSLSAIKSTELSAEAIADGSKRAEKTAWLDVDNIFHEARGASWAYLHIFKALRHDFHGTLKNKMALQTIDQIIQEFENAQADTWSPVVLNGDGFGIFANYSLTMANYIAHANANTIDLQDLLIRG